MSFFETSTCTVISAVTWPTTYIWKLWSALFPACFKISCSHFGNVSARQNDWRKKNCE